MFFLHLLAQIILSLSITTCVLLPPRHESEENYAVCQGKFLQSEKLKENLRNITKSINVFELRNATIDVLPGDIFSDVENANVRKIIFSHSSVDLLHIPERKISPLKSVEDSLENFEIYDSSSVFGWNFSVLASLKKLKTLIIENSEIFEVKGGFETLSTLRFIQILNSDVQWIHPYVFQNNDNLTICSLANNHIVELKRSMFPKPAKHLWSLDLSFNKIRSLPKDMFAEMPSLHELKLDSNRLKIFEVDRVVPVWDRLTQLWIDDNNVLCWPFCRVAGKKHRPQFLDSSKCSLAKSRIHYEPVQILDSFYSFCFTGRKRF
ncbi:uncharacterized protein CDAR_222971 [Caerostris darwini]|uniref:Uncharacterized protein n=1 Tax=Caerostris darwini TaxID=1538125 RepID=A0AAV4RL67_9ARAC|nr:uncharacterized protein CDAR_222971 [Caerostris darwini]